MDEPDDSALEDGQLLEIAAAISDGTPIDWSAHDWPRIVSSASDESPLISRLRQVELIVRGHQRLIESQSSAVSAGTSAAAETLLTEAGRTVSTNPNPIRVEWGPLIVLDKIGRGSFGDVYRAWDPRLDREVALKLVTDSPAEVATPAFEEGRLLARVRHPNVVTVYGAERINDRVGIWMEYVRGVRSRTRSRERARCRRRRPHESGSRCAERCRQYMQRACCTAM